MLTRIFRRRRSNAVPLDTSIPDVEALDWFERFLDDVLDRETTRVAASGAPRVESGRYLHLLALRMKLCGASPEMVGMVRCFADHLWGRLDTEPSEDQTPAAVAAD